MPEEEYELVPLSPIRRMEKRLERLEKAGTGNDMIRELIEVVKTNQQIVDDVVRINSEMIKRVSELSENVGRVTNKFDEFMSRIETVDQAPETKSESVALEAKLDKLEKRITNIVSASQRRMVSPPVRAPLPPPNRPMARPLTARRPLAPPL